MKCRSWPCMQLVHSITVARMQPYYIVLGSKVWTAPWFRSTAAVAFTDTSEAKVRDHLETLLLALVAGCLVLLWVLHICSHFIKLHILANAVCMCIKLQQPPKWVSDPSQCLSLGRHCTAGWYAYCTGWSACMHVVLVAFGMFNSILCVQSTGLVCTYGITRNNSGHWYWDVRGCLYDWERGYYFIW